MTKGSEQLDYRHTSVLFNESIEALSIKADGIYLDGTFGRGGHSRGILEKLGENGRLIALDRDPDAIKAAETLAEDQRFSIFHTAFANMLDVAESLDLVGKFDGIFLDIGVSSPQLDDASRGFSFMHDGPLDMRMDTTQGISAAEWLNTAELEDISYVLKTYGEEKFGRRIATAVVEARQETPLVTTDDFVKIIDAAVPVKDKFKHPATRSFQGVRIFINRELEQLELALNAACKMLDIGGRLAVISFHSLEDRLVKRFIKQKSQGKSVPSKLPMTQQELDKGKELKALSRAIKASEKEVQANPRSRSAVLRVAEKL
ncbi:16S rRNA (cytosine(1402)-N(4))-methyltransferase RsmH [Agaribacter flavus]|uniref:Ribosomal RNA small subunit methyltransferase H n=1 Tax=Agaribacter flavus TaxID=1902781 RepID=A0ABV7FP99_9ALTE